MLAQHASRTCQSIKSANNRCRRSSFTFPRSSCRLCCRLSATNRQDPSVLGKASVSPLRAVCDRSDRQSIAYIFTVVCLDRSCFPDAWREVKYLALSKLSSFQGLPKHFKPHLWRPQQNRRHRDILTLFVRLFHQPRRLSRRRLSNRTRRTTRHTLLTRRFALCVSALRSRLVANQDAASTVQAFIPSPSALLELDRLISLASWLISLFHTCRSRRSSYTSTCHPHGRGQSSRQGFRGRGSRELTRLPEGLPKRIQRS